MEASTDPDGLLLLEANHILFVAVLEGHQIGGLCQFFVADGLGTVTGCRPRGCAFLVPLFFCAPAN